MDFHLLPTFRVDPENQVPRTPYVAAEHYDGGPWLTYPTRKRKLKGVLKDGSFDVIEYARSERINPTPLRETESFFQTWLYFGLIAEFTGANAQEKSAFEDISENSMLDRLYTIILSKDANFVALKMEVLDEILALGRASMPRDLDGRMAHYKHLKLCLSTAYACAAHFPPDLNHAIRCSIAALGELFMTTINYALEMVGLPLLGRDWKTGFLNDELEVPEEDLTEVLFKEDKFPLLLLKGNIRDLSYEIVESAGEETPYIAISHVWADGLGNPHTNSLHKCKLHFLRGLVDAVNTSDPPPALAKHRGSLIWLDTLLSPARDGRGKQTAIEKIRLVYQSARHVLVLDAGLMAYPSAPQNAPEMLTRIFTSSWMRRLWTLQEGALASSLYFQFQDQAKSLNALAIEVFSRKLDMRYRALAHNIHLEMLGLLGFFNPSLAVPGGILALLDRALQFRSVSVASDEALCIATLLGLNLKEVLGVEKTQQARMQKIWSLIATKNGGVPSQILFLEEPKLAADGWKWAPKSLLNSQNEGFGLSTRLMRWADPDIGKVTKKGLKVQYPGYRLMLRQEHEYGDGKPVNPWPGMPRIPEDWLQFRDETGRWWRVVEKRFAALSKKWESSGEAGQIERRKHADLEGFPLSDLVASGTAVVMFRKKHEGEGEMCEAIFGMETKGEDGMDSELDGALDDSIFFNSKYYVLVQQLREESYTYEIIAKLALQLRADPLTEAHLTLHKQLKPKLSDSADELRALTEENQELRASVQALRGKMKVLAATVIEEDARFKESVRKNFGEKFLGKIWVLIQDYFNHDIIIEKLGEETVWFVD